MTTDDPEGVTPQSQALSSLVVKLREVKYKRSYLGRGSTGDFKDIVVDEKRNKYVIRRVLIGYWWNES